MEEEEGWREDEKIKEVIKKGKKKKGVMVILSELKIYPLSSILLPLERCRRRG